MFSRLSTLSVTLLVFLTLPAFAAEPAPDFTLPSFPDNTEINLKDFKGRVVYLDFWATWCPPCRKSFPWMDEMHERYKDEGLSIIAVSVDKKRELIAQFINKTESTFIIAHDATGEVAKIYKLRAMPTSYLIDRNGQLVMTRMGFRSSDKDKMEAAIQEQLEK
ncbi:MAG: TlpA family protein disulfide reductase [Gammaproteobacteria bacterium]|nr:TlpA family protein disulfide reductase [Gammaproteobacteria bacterium]